MLDFASDQADLHDPTGDVIHRYVDGLLERDSFRGSLLIVTHARLF